MMNIIQEQNILINFLSAWVGMFIMIIQDYPNKIKKFYENRILILGKNKRKIL